MSCNPNVVTIVSPDNADVRGFYVGSKAVLVTAYNLTGEDTITFKRVNYCSVQANFKRDECCLIQPTPAEIASAVMYQLGECSPMLSPTRSMIVIRYSGNYVPVVTNASSADLTVTVEPINGTEFTDKELGIEPCGFRVEAVDTTWETTGTERCNQHFVEVEEISDLGNVRWTKTKKRCGYSASVPLPISLNDSDCCGSQFMGYVFHPNETRDPDATVEIRDCEGNLYGYAYPKAGDGHTLPIAECDGNIKGYAVNHSSTAPQVIMC